MCGVNCVALHLICNLKASQFSAEVINRTMKPIRELEFLETGITYRSV